MKSKKRVLSPVAADIIGMSNSGLCKMRKRGEGPKYYKIGGRFFYDLDDLNMWIEAQAVDPEAA